MKKWTMERTPSLALIGSFIIINFSILFSAAFTFAQTVSFGPATSFATGASPRDVATGDLNGDGNADLAVANRSGNSVSVLLGEGTGGFGAATDYAVSAAPYFVAIGDLNGDGKPESLQLQFYTSNHKYRWGFRNHDLG